MITFQSEKPLRQGTIATSHGEIIFPTFMPDATYGTVQNLSWNDLKATGVREIVTTALHLEQKAGSQNIEKNGGFHQFTGWDRPVLTDSGGFQVFSLIYRSDNKDNHITEAGCSFRDYTNGQYNFLTPEISQVIQHNLKSDIRLVLDIPINEDSSLSHIKESVARNTRWAKRSKDFFLKLNNLTENDFNNPQLKRPLLGAIVQGANNFQYREQSAKELIEIGFDLYCFGGLPLHHKLHWNYKAPQGFHEDLVSFVASLLPKDKIRYAMGLGSPDDLIYATKTGWDLFDTVIPSRNARHGYLFVSSGAGDESYKSYDVLHIRSLRYKDDDLPVDPHCQCETCRTTSRKYLRYLIKIKSSVGFRLATIHNLTYYMKTMEKIRKMNY
ncbi:MAG: tRNA guanosine(34) transglycosylase Tgt [bacterium]